MKNQARQIRIKGLVQGVGFRPFVYRLAYEFGLKGTVENNNTGVEIFVEGTEQELEAFLQALPHRIPQAASISSLDVKTATPRGFADFRITKSRSLSDEVTEVSPDIAVCDACLQDMKSQPNRIDYPFTNCTNCGPRFTIIRDLPYDRPKTTMEPFVMCDDCRREYEDILDRRFHAQPVACKHCGPHYTLHFNGRQLTEIHPILAETARLLEAGEIVAMKGLGGYHLACDAGNEASVQRLRKSKNREGKPFALMFRDVETVKEYLVLNTEEEELLTGWRRPVVLLKIKKSLAPSVSIGLDTVGAMLPYMPFHHMLFEKLKLPAIVLTSGNISDEPIIIGNEEALQTLGPISAATLTYNREIYNRTDDSVAFVAGGQSRLIRRSRSYAPSPVQTNLQTEGIFAAGAELVNCFCIGKGTQAIPSQYIGDLKNLETLDFYRESVERFQRLFRFKPELTVADKHPDYLSTRFAQESGLPLLLVQHHHAHMASCMAEHGLDETVLGITFDGTGLGDDGHIWGGEFLVGDLAGFERFAQLEYVPQPGGDAVTKHPWRMMLAYLYHYFGEDALSRFAFVFEGIAEKEMEGVLFLLRSGVNTPLTSSAGRLFDAVSALLGICRHARYHAEAPMQLEAAAADGIDEHYRFEGEKIISFKTTFEEMLHDLQKNTDTKIIAAKFHNTLVRVVVHVAEAVRKEKELNKIVLSGGSFQNRILLEKCEQLLEKSGFTVFSHRSIPSNDGGIALGQLAIAAKKRALGLLTNETTSSNEIH